MVREGWRLLPHYSFDPESGVWRHRESRPGRVLCLEDICYQSGRMQYRSSHITEPESALIEYMEQAQSIIDEMKRLDESGEAPTITVQKLDSDLERLRWFPLPGE